MLLSKSAVHTAVQEWRLDRSAELSHEWGTEIGEKVKIDFRPSVSECPREAPRQSSVTDTGTYRGARNSTT